MTEQQGAIQALDLFIAEEMERGRTPGLALIILRDGRVIHQRGYGFADLAAGIPMSECTGVVIGSTTKALTCAAVVQLADRGLLSLDDPIRRFLPGFHVAEEAASAAMTVRQALTHTAGLPPSASDQPGFLLSDDDADDALERYVDQALPTRVPLWAPGGGWVYANDGWAIAGRIIEVLSGLSYEEYMRRNLFSPLGLTDAAFSPGERPGLAIATPYDYDAGGQPYPSFFPHQRATAAAGGALILTARDAGRWLQAMLDGGRVPGGRLVSEQGFAELVRAHTPMPAASRGLDGDEASYGLGWMIGTLNGIPAISHGGATITMGSNIVVAPDERLAIAVLANSVTEVTSIVAEAALSLLLGREPARRFPRLDPAFEPDRSLWPRLAGRYRPLEPQNRVPGPLQVDFDGQRLFARTYPGDARRRPGHIFLAPAGDLAFVLLGRGKTGAEATFIVDGDMVSATWDRVPLAKE